MLNKLREIILNSKNACNLLPRGYFLVPVLVLFSSIIIRVSTGGTYYVYNALNGRGLFPGPFAYSLFFFLRLLICSEILAYILYCVNTYREKISKAMLILFANLLLLLEYKLIFGGISIILGILSSAGVCLFTFMTLKQFRITSNVIKTFALCLLILEGFFIIQLISLSFCI